MWPLAAANIVREDDDATNWARLHARQALVLGLIGTFVFVFVLALPLIVVIAASGITSAVTITVYLFGLAADAVVALVLLGISIRYAARASRGELFSIPIVSQLVDRWMRARPP